MKLLVILLSLLVLVGCAVSLEDIKWAEEKCKNNEGIKHILPSLSTFVRCNNGMEAQK